MLNSKGFSLVELLAAITIIGLLMGAMTIGYTRYQKKAIDNSYKTMFQSAGEAAEEYFMDHHNENQVTIETLVKEAYLSNADDPADKNNTAGCSGKVINQTPPSNSSDSLSKLKYLITIECTNYTDTKIYPDSNNN